MRPERLSTYIRIVVRNWTSDHLHGCDVEDAKRSPAVRARVSSPRLVVISQVGGILDD